MSSMIEHPQSTDSPTPLSTRPAVAQHPSETASPATLPPDQNSASTLTQVDQKRLRMKLRRWLAERIEAGLDNSTDLKRNDQTIALLRERFDSVYKMAGINLPADDERRLEVEVLDELIGYGPLEPLLQDPATTEVMVNGPFRVFIEQKGRVLETPVQFEDDAHVMRIVDRILRPLSRRVDRKWPMADARLPDGSRVNVIVPPSAIDGPTITIRKFAQNKLTTDDLNRFGSLTPSMAEFLRACVVARINIVVAGGTGSGKTTLLNILSDFIPDHDRIVTIEDSAELQLAKPHVVRLEAHPPDPDGTGRVTIRDLVINALRMRPERIVVGEVRDAAALDMLQAMNTGHDGSLTTLHANTPRDAISRLETMTLMAGIEFPLRVVREQIAAAIDLIVQQARMRDGSRKIIQITEVQGMEGDIIVLQDIFRFVERGQDDEGRVLGEFQASGMRPKFSPRLDASGIQLSSDIFKSNAPSSGRK